MLQDFEGLFYKFPVCEYLTCDTVRMIACGKYDWSNTFTSLIHEQVEIPSDIEPFNT